MKIVPIRTYSTLVDGCIVHGDAPLTNEGRKAVADLIAAVRDHVCGEKRNASQCLVWTGVTH